MTLHSVNLFLLTLPSFVLMESKLDSHNIRAIWHFGKDTWLKFRKGRLVNLGKLFYFSYPYFYYL